MMQEYPAMAWKITWSYNGYRGWDQRAYEEWVRGTYRGFGYVKQYGFGHEWWNFYEGFDDKYYYGYAPPIHSMLPKKLSRGGIVFFISRHPWMSSWFLVGIYGGVEILSRSSYQGLLWELVPEEYRESLREATAAELRGENPGSTPPSFLLRAEKALSTPMPQYMGINMERDLGVRRLGQGFNKYMEGDKALVLLNRAISHVEGLVYKGDKYYIDPREALARLTRLRERLEGMLSLESWRKASTVLFSEQLEKTEDLIEGGPEPSGIPERLLEKTIAENLEILERGLSLIGKQVFIKDIGRVDILARDREDRPVVIEVKSGLADDASLTQILAYLSAIESDKPPRGIIVAEGFSRKLMHAVRMQGNVKLIRIKASVNIEKVEEIP